MTKTASQAEPLSVGRLPHTRRPDFFIVGAPKCGTSALAHYLAAHPDIFMGRKEMHAFGADLCFGSQFLPARPRRIPRGIRRLPGPTPRGRGFRLVSLQHRCRRRDQVAEPGLTNHHHAAGTGGDDVLALSTSSGSTATSICPCSKRPSPPRGIAGPAGASGARRISRRDCSTGKPRATRIRFAAISMFRPRTGRDHSLRRLSRRPRRCYARTLDFLGVAPNPVDIDFKVINGNKSARSSALQSVLNEPLLRSAAIALRPWLPRPVFATLQKVEARVQGSVTRFEKRPPLDSDLRARLKAEFATEVERLGALLGRDLSHWSC